MVAWLNYKRTLVNLYTDIVLGTRLSIFCTTLFTINNIKVVIQMHAFLFDLAWDTLYKYLLFILNKGVECESSAGKSICTKEKPWPGPDTQLLPTWTWNRVSLQ